MLLNIEFYSEFSKNYDKIFPLNQVKAIDFDSEMVSLAESKMQKLKAEVDFYRLGMLHLKEKLFMKGRER